MVAIIINIIHLIIYKLANFPIMSSYKWYGTGFDIFIGYFLMCTLVYYILYLCSRVMGVYITPPLSIGAPILFRLLGFFLFTPKDFKIFLLSNLLIMSVPDEGYSRQKCVVCTKSLSPCGFFLCLVYSSF